MGCRGEELVLGLFAKQGVVAVADTGRIDHIDWPERASVACGLGKELALDVIDDHAAPPGEKLAGGQKPLASPGRRDHQKVSELAAGPGRPDAKHTAELTHPQQQARLRIPGGVTCLKACQLVQVRKARVVKVLAAMGEGLGQPVESHQKPVEKPGQERR
jgi:hypothetical protein